MWKSKPNTGGRQHRCRRPTNDPTKAEEMHDSPDNDFRFEMNALRWIDADVASRLWTRGWAVADLAIEEGESLEWFWTPTAPVGYGGLPDWGDETMQLSDHSCSVHGRPHGRGPPGSPEPAAFGLSNTARRSPRSQLRAAHTVTPRR